jgi:APA family basic amino acid/polyamine antiporter
VAAISLVVASMVGTGIFTTTGFLAARLPGPAWVFGAWLAGGVLALCGATVYAELGAMLPRAGGEYVYLSRGLSPAFGFLSGWVSLWVGFAAPIALSAEAFGSYLQSVFPGVSAKVAGALLLSAMTALHMADVRWGSRVQVATTALKLTGLVVLVAAGLTMGHGSWERVFVAHDTPRAGVFAVALVMVSFAYQGWNAAAYVAGEIEDPARNVPFAILGGTVLVMGLYLALNVVFFYAVPASVLAAAPERAVAVASEALFGPRVRDGVALVVAVALVSSVGSLVMTGPRVTVAMAEDGLFFAALGRRGVRGAPTAAVALQGVLALVMLVATPFVELLMYVGFTLSLFSALTVVAAAMLRHTAADAPRPYRALAWPLSGALFVILSVATAVLALIETPLASLAGAATLAIGMVVHVLWSRGHRQGRGEQRR